MTCFRPNMPEEIWQHIYSLMSLRDAARGACVSRAFVSYWRSHPNLVLNRQTVGFLGLTRKIDHILRGHSGIGLKIFKLEYDDCHNPDASNYLDSWLRIAVTPWLEELKLKLFTDGLFDNEISDEFPPYSLKYNFPCSVLSGGSGSLIRYLHLECCAFRPRVKLGCFRSLTRLHLRCVCIKGEELEYVLSISVMLEQLELKHCCEIICLKIPRCLHRLRYLFVHGCSSLQVVENKAQNICSINLSHIPADCLPVELFQLGELLQLKNMDMWCNDVACYALSELPSIAPNIETLILGSLLEMTIVPAASTKFFHLKFLSIHLHRVNLLLVYDYLSLASFMDSSPSLESFNLTVPQKLMPCDLICENSVSLRQMPQHRHHNLRSFKITGFSSTKSLVELACHVLENTTSLQYVTLDTTFGGYRCSGDNSSSKKCHPMAVAFCGPWMCTKA